MSLGALPQGTAEPLARTLYVQCDHETTAEQALAAAALASPSGAGTAISAAHATFVQWADALQAAEDANQDLKAAQWVLAPAPHAHEPPLHSAHPPHAH